MLRYKIVPYYSDVSEYLLVGLMTDLRRKTSIVAFGPPNYNYWPVSYVLARGKQLRLSQRSPATLTDEEYQYLKREGVLCKKDKAFELLLAGEQLPAVPQES